VEIGLTHCITRGFRFSGLLHQVAGLLTPDILKRCTTFFFFKGQGVHDGGHGLIDTEDENITFLQNVGNHQL
jgi:hypothetical protein